MKIAIVTGSRAEYGLLSPLLARLEADPDIDLFLIVTGQHINSIFINEIKYNYTTVDINLQSENVAKAIGLSMLGLSDIFDRAKPDLFIAIGDRYEMLGAVITAVTKNIPVVHLHGGELTGGLDGLYRHAISKMSNLHFTSTERYRLRLIGMGEQPNMVFNVGALSVDNIESLKLLSKDDIENQLDIKFKEKNILVTFHPQIENTWNDFNQLLAYLMLQSDIQIIFTSANSDKYGKEINDMVYEFCGLEKHGIKFFDNLGSQLYLSLMQYVDAVVGNSSSGIVEAPYFTATINIGNRQKGRERTKSIIDCEPTIKDISQAFKKLYSSEFQESLKEKELIYGDGNTAEKIVEIIKDKMPISIVKRFYE